MQTTGDARDLNRIGTTSPRSGADAFGLLKTATTFAKRKPREISAAPPARAEPSREQPVAPAAPSPGDGPSIISLRVEMTGSITSPDELHIYGKIDGNVRASSLTICEGGSVKGEVIAETVTVRGTIEGRIVAQKAQLLAGAVVRGDIVHASLGVDTAAIFEGVSKRTQNPMAETPALAKA